MKLRIVIDCQRIATLSLTRATRRACFPSSQEEFKQLEAAEAVAEQAIQVMP